MMENVLRCDLANESDWKKELYAQLATAQTEIGLLKEHVRCVINERELATDLLNTAREALEYYAQSIRNRIVDDGERARSALSRLSSSGAQPTKDDLWSSIRERDARINGLLRALDRYRYAHQFAAADSWNGGSDMRMRLEWAHSSDEGRHLTNNQIAAIGKLYGEKEAAASPGAQQTVTPGQIKSRLDCRLNDRLCGMKEGHDDSIVGFNEAWDIMRGLFEEIAASPGAQQRAGEDEG